jgi:hypothetical protein
MKNLLVCLLMLFEVFFSSCGEEKRRNYIILLDNSATIKEEVFDKYLKVIMNSVFPNIGMHDKLTIMFIDECALTQAERIFAFDLSQMYFSNRLDGLNARQDSIKARLGRYLVKRILPEVRVTIQKARGERRNCNNYTDITNAIQVASSLLSREKSFATQQDVVVNSALVQDNYKYENILLIFSDMIQESPDQILNFESFGAISQEKVKKIFNNFKNNKPLPDLKDSKVIVYGATSGKAQRNMANQQVMNIKLFWEEYFKGTNAKLGAYGYDTRIEIEKMICDSKD